MTFAQVVRPFSWQRSLQQLEDRRQRWRRHVHQVCQPFTSSFSPENESTVSFLNCAQSFQHEKLLERRCSMPETMRCCHIRVPWQQAQNFPQVILTASCLDLGGCGEQRAFRAIGLTTTSLEDAIWHAESNGATFSCQHGTHVGSHEH